METGEYSVYKAARLAKVPDETARRWWKARDLVLAQGIVPTAFQESSERLLAWERDNPEPLVRVSQLSPTARECLQSFEKFNEVVFHDTLYDYQREWIHQLLSDNHSMVLAPPRHGKTEVFSVRLPCWLLCGGGYPLEYYLNPDNPLRNNQILLFSDTESQAKKNFRAIEARLTGQNIVKIFGRFKDDDSPWTASSGTLIVAGREREKLSGDWSLQCAGGKSAVLGFGFNWILVDDPARITNTRTPEQTEELFLRFRTEVMSRLEPEGRMMVMGAHLPVPQDLYTMIEQIPFIEDDEWIDEAAVTEDLDCPRLFTTVRQPAVLDWDTKTILSPKPNGRYSWRAVMEIRARVGQQTWEATYMQNPGSGLVSLCAPEWIMGDSGFVGCLDKDRALGEAREHFSIGHESFPLHRILSVDPSPTKYAGVICMDIPQLRTGEYRPILLDIERGIFPTQVLCGLFYEMWAKYNYRTLVLEWNAAHNLVQSSDYQQFLDATGVQVVQHKTTGQTKNNELYGKRTLADDVMRGFIRIPYADSPARLKFSWLINELTERLPTDDTVMALWFPKWSLQGITAKRSNSHWTGFGVRRDVDFQKGHLSAAVR